MWFAIPLRAISHQAIPPLFWKFESYNNLTNFSIFCNNPKLTPILKVLCGLLSLCAQFHTRPLPLFGRVKSVGSYPLSLRLQCKCFRKIISRSRRAATARAPARPQRSRIFAGVRSHFLLQLPAVISTQ